MQEREVLVTANHPYFWIFYHTTCCSCWEGSVFKQRAVGKSIHLIFWLQKKQKGKFKESSKLCLNLYSCNCCNWLNSKPSLFSNLIPKCYSLRFCYRAKMNFRTSEASITITKFVMCFLFCNIGLFIVHQIFLLYKWWSFLWTLVL